MGTAKEILEKHKGKYAKKQKSDASLAKVIRDKKTSVKEDIGEVTGSVLTPTPLSDYKRSDLMKEAKEKGIKYFRILNKEELAKILSFGDSPDQMQQLQTLNIQSAAKQRWQAGWGSKPKEPANVPA